MIDESTEFGARVAGHLREDTLVWLKTVTPSGAPLPRPVGFLWSGSDQITVYSQPGARIRNIRHNPKVTLNFRGDPNGGDIVVLTGLAEWTSTHRARLRTVLGSTSTRKSGLAPG